MVSALLHDLQVSHLDTADSEVRDLELHSDSSLELLAVCGADRWEPELCSHEVLLSPGELLDHPLHCVFFRCVCHSSTGGLEHRRVNVCWYWDQDLDIVRGRLRLELSFGFDEKLNLGLGVVLNDTFYVNQRFDSCIESVVHQLEVSIRRDELDRSILLELC